MLNKPILNNNLTVEQKNKLLEKIQLCMEKIERLHPQEFCKMLMIFETVFQLLQKFLNRLGQLNAGFTSITIIVDTQIPEVSQIIEDGLLWYFLFAASRKKSFEYNPIDIDKIQRFLHQGKYLKVIELIHEVKVMDDKNNSLLYVPDYISNFTRKTLRGTIQSHAIVDKLHKLYITQSPMNQFHPMQEYIDAFIPAESEYAVNTLILNNKKHAHI